jgi:hypothetical protein
MLTRTCSAKSGANTGVLHYIETQSGQKAPASSGRISWRARTCVVPCITSVHRLAPLTCNGMRPVALASKSANLVHPRGLCTAPAPGERTPRVPHPHTKPSRASITVSNTRGACTGPGASTARTTSCPDHEHRPLTAHYVPCWKQK